MTKQYRVTLSRAERDELTVLMSKGKAAARKLAHARLLRPVDESVAEARSTDEQVAQALPLSRRTIERVRERFVEQGFAAALVPWPSTRP
jgi:hypothetical protein